MILSFILFPVMAKIPHFSAYKVDFMLPFFVCGIYLRRNCNRLITDKRLLVPYILLFIICMMLWKSDYIWYNSRSQWFSLKQMYLNRTFIFDWYNLFCVIIRFIVGCVSSLFLMSLFYQIGQSRPGSYLFPKIAKYGQYTLHIYILQTFLTEMNILNINLPIEDIVQFQFIYTPIISLLVTVVSTILAMIMEKNKYINKYLFGK